MRVLTSTRSKGLLMKSLRAGLQRAQFVARLRGQHDDRQVGIVDIGLQPLDHLEAVHARHLQIEQDQVVAVAAMQRAHLARDSSSTLTWA